MDYDFQFQIEAKQQQKPTSENPKGIPNKRKKLITNAMRGLPHFTHFMSLPFIRKQHREDIKAIQQIIKDSFQQNGYKNVLRQHSFLLGHITLFMLTLKLQETKKKVTSLLKQSQNEIKQIIKGLKIKMGKVKYFTRVNKSEKCDQVTVIYLDLADQESQIKLARLIDFLVRIMLKEQILIHEELKSMHIFFDHNNNLFKAQGLHMSLFRCNGLMVRDKTVDTFTQINQKIESTFKHLQFDCDFMDVSTMLQAYGADGFYAPLVRINIQDQLK